MEKNIFKKKVDRLINQYNVGNIRFVIEQAQILLKKYPNNSFLYNLIGLSLQRLGKMEAAIDQFSVAVQIDSKNSAAYNNLGNTYKSLKRYDEAKENYQKSLNNDPNFIHSLMNLGNLYFEMNDHEQAISYLNKAIETNDKFSEAHYNLGIVYQSIGNFEKSKIHMEKVLEIDPKNTKADKIISRYTNYKEDKSHLSVMEKKINDLDLDNFSKMNLFFGLGKAYEDLKNYEKSFVNIKNGNQLKKDLTKYKIDKDLKLLSKTREIFENYNFSSIKETISKKIIFIVGLPRSGTSLIEQIISSHSSVYGCGELDYLDRLIKSSFFINYKLDTSKFNNLNETNIKLIAENYLKFVEKLEPNSLVYTDKAPLNFVWIGFIKIFFPNAKIVHCVRNPKDNILSLYKNNFDEHLNFSNDLDDLYLFYKEYYNLMKFWKTKLPNFIHDAVYEDIIKEPKDQIKKLLKFCNLDFEESCIDFYNNKRLIKTVSAAQARKPLYNSSISSYRNYEKFIGDIFLKIDKLK